MPIFSFSKGLPLREEGGYILDIESTHKPEETHIIWSKLCQLHLLGLEYHAPVPFGRQQTPRPPFVFRLLLDVLVLQSFAWWSWLLPSSSSPISPRCLVRLGPCTLARRQWRRAPKSKRQRGQVLGRCPLDIQSRGTPLG
jgi:hypothetical protein